MNIEHRSQFSLSCLLVGVAVFSVALVFRLEFLEFLDRCFFLSTVLAFVCGFLVCRYITFPRSNAWWMTFVFMAVVCIYACFAKYRMNASVIDIGFPRDLPYPDKMIIQSVQYWAQPLETVPPGSIDFHRGMTETLAIAQWSAIISAVVTGISAGAAVRPRRRRITKR